MDHVADRQYLCVINIPWFMKVEVRIPPGASTVEVLFYQILVIATTRFDKPNPLCFLHAECFIYFLPCPANPQRMGTNLRALVTPWDQPLNWGGVNQKDFCDDARINKILIEYYTWRGCFKNLKDMYLGLRI